MINGIIPLNIDPVSHLVDPICFLDSPHCDERPVGMPIELIVIHGISLPPGEFGTGAIDRFFCGVLSPTEHPYFATIASLCVSAHILINREGVMTQFVPFDKRAWHAGVSNYAGREACNDFSIGIELEGTDECAYAPIQYETLATLIHALMLRYKAITPDRIVGHSDIAPGRKTDPGPFFDWALLKTLLKGKSA
jgi:N-acetyl-anhydromuramoyl-L-alanine amidase